MSYLLENGGAVNSKIKIDLDLGEDRYEKIKLDLKADGLVESYRCRGGGVRLTQSGEKRAPKKRTNITSKFKNEKSIYPKILQFLNQESDDASFDGFSIDTSNYRKSGKWQNPDITQVVFEYYELLRLRKVIVKTYEVKKWGSFNIEGVFEAASQRRVSHESYLCIEWPDKNKARIDLTSNEFRLSDISRECQRFGIGFMTIEPHYNSWRLVTHLEPEQHQPSEAEIESWLEYVFERNPQAKEQFQKMQRSAD